MCVYSFFMQDLSPLQPKQIEFGYNPCIRKLEEKRQVLFVGECGIGKTYIGAKIASTKYSEKGIVCCFMEGKYIPNWIDTLLKIPEYQGRHAIDIQDQSTWADGLYIRLDSQVMQCMNTTQTTARMRQARAELYTCFHALTQHRTNHLFVFIDNFYLMGTSKNQSGERVYTAVKTNPKAQNISFQRPMRELYPIMKTLFLRTNLILLDECDWIRSDGHTVYQSLMALRKTDLKNAHLLMISATPLGGLDKDVPAVAQFMKMKPDKSIKDEVEKQRNLNRKVRDNIVVCKKRDVADEHYAPCHVAFVNVSRATAFFEGNFLKITLGKAWNIVQKWIVDGELSKEEQVSNKVLYYQKEKMWTVMYAVEQMLADKSGFYEQLLLTTERIKQAWILKYLIENVFKIDCFVHVSGSDADIPPDVLEQKIPNDNEVIEARKQFNEGKIRVYIQGILAGGKSWSAVPTDPKRRILHIVVSGVCPRYTDWIQTIGRTHRFSTKTVTNIAILVSNKKKDIETSVVAQSSKQNRIEEVLEDDQRLENMLLEASEVSAQDKSLVQKWQEGEVEAATKESFGQFMFGDSNQKWHLPGIEELNSLCYNLVDTDWDSTKRPKLESEAVQTCLQLESEAVLQCLQRIRWKLGGMSL